VSGARSVVRARRMKGLRNGLSQLGRDPAGMTGLVLLALFGGIALAAPLIADRSELLVEAGRYNANLARPSLKFLLGTDEVGRSVLAQLVWGARVSLFIGLFATCVAIVIGSTIGLASGYMKGRIGTLLLAIDDFFLVIPFLPLAIVLAVLLGRSPLIMAFVIGLTSWAGVARLVRAQVLSLSERGYVDRARSLGASRRYIMVHHILPGTMPIIIANATLVVPIAILTESTLSFLGFGDRLSPSWGRLLEGAQSSGSITLNAWWYYLPPGLCIIGVVMAFTLFGRALERVFDPRLAGR